jgi:hypothetical protein
MDKRSLTFLHPLVTTASLRQPISFKLKSQFRGWKASKGRRICQLLLPDKLRCYVIVLSIRYGTIAMHTCALEQDTGFVKMKKAISMVRVNNNSHFCPHIFIPVELSGTDKTRHTHTGKICDTQNVARHIFAVSGTLANNPTDKCVES